MYDMVVSRFQRKTYRALRRIPQGKVITYKGLAERIACASARAVGMALAKNPFPITIPCHRVVKSDRSLGGFSVLCGGKGRSFAKRQQGPELKKALLELEGVIFDKDGRIAKESFV